MNTTTIQMKVIKGFRGFYAESDIPLDEKRVVRIHTGKGGRGLYSSAQVGEVGNSCGMESFTTMLCGDFHKNILNSDKRCTEKSVTELHKEALTQADSILEEAKAFYANKEVKA